jgi:glycosyltransferase involved in cell wall biosynthesis
MLSSISWRTPPRAYGPWELITSLLTEALIARGIDVTLFATRDSQTLGKLDGVAPRGYSEDPTLDAKVWEALHIAHLFERAGEFDLIHNQADFMPLIFARLVETPIVTTIHGFSSPRILPVFERYDGRVHYVSISEADRVPSLNYAATIHHGIRVEEFPFEPEGGSDLVFFGRIHPDKGAAEAIRAATATRHRLAMYGLVQDEGYYSREVQPFVDGTRIIYHGMVGGAERLNALGQAKGLLHMIGFDEPIELTVIEEMGVGTPIVA